MVEDVLAAEGEMNFWQVRMKPGKPLAFGHILAASEENRRLLLGKEHFRRAQAQGGDDFLSQVLEPV